MSLHRNLGLLPLFATLAAVLLTLVPVPSLEAQTVAEALNRVSDRERVGGRARQASPGEQKKLVSYILENGGVMPGATYLLEGTIAGGKGKAVVYLYTSEADAQKMYEVMRRVSQSEIERVQAKQEKAQEYFYVMKLSEGAFEDTRAFLVRMKYEGITREEAAKAPDQPGKKEMLALIGEWEGKNLQTLTWRQGNMVVGLDSILLTASNRSIKPFGRALYAELAGMGGALTVRAWADRFEDLEVEVPLTVVDPTSILITGRILDEYGGPVQGAQATLHDPKVVAVVQPSGDYRIFVKLREPDDRPLQASRDITLKQRAVMMFTVRHKAYPEPVHDFIEMPTGAGRLILRGKVVDRRARKPVPDAEVTLSDLLGHNGTATTDPRGNYEMELTLGGKEETRLTKQVAIEGDMLAVYLGFRLQSDRYPTKKYTVRRSRYGPVKTYRVQGTVVDSLGDPVAGVRVSCMISGTGRGEGITGSDGSYLVEIETNPDGMWQQTVDAGRLQVGVPDPMDVVIKQIKQSELGEDMDKKFLNAANKLVGDRLDQAPKTYRLMWKNAGAVVALKSDVDKIKDALVKGDKDAIKKAMKFENFKKYEKVLKQGGLGEYANALKLLSDGVKSTVNPLKAADDLETKVKELNDKFKDNTGVDILKQTGFGQQKGQTVLQKSFHQLLLHVGATQYALDNVR